MQMIGPEDYKRFEDSDDTTFIGTLPVAGKIDAENVQMAIESISVYSDRMTLAFSLRIRDGHPELAWRDRGRPGHPYTAIGITDDIGTTYMVMPGSGGGGMKEWTSQVRIVPAPPQLATTIVIYIAETEWEGHMGFRQDGTREQPIYCWCIDVDTSELILARNATQVSKETNSE